MRFVVAVLLLFVAVVTARSLTSQKQKSLAALQSKAWLARFARSRHYGKNFAIATSLASQGFEGYEHFIGTAGTLEQSGAISMDLSIPGEAKSDFDPWSKATTNSPVLDSKDGVDWRYAEMTAIAGDYFGPKRSVDTIICWDDDMGGTRKESDMPTRFKNAFNDMWENPEYGHDTKNGKTTFNWKNYMTQDDKGNRDNGLISQARALLAKERAGYLTAKATLQKAGMSAANAGSAYYDQPGSTASMLAGRVNHNNNPWAAPNLENIGFAESLEYNDDHWSTCADRTIAYGHKLAVKTAYEAGQTASKANLADRTATKQIRNQLIEAYAISGFTSHFVSDRFSSGHIRTPFTVLRHFGPKLGVKTAMSTGLTGNVQHDEENKNCLLVKNKLGHLWWACGDHRFFDDVNAQNRRQIRDTMEAIIKSIRNAFLDGLKNNNKNLNTYNNVPFDWLPTTELDTPRQRLENICPMFVFRNGKLYARKLTCILTGVPRPLSAANNNIAYSGTPANKFGASIASTASSELFPARKTVQITYMPNLPKGTWECEYVEATKYDFCTPMGRATPALSKDAFTYVNACKAAQDIGSKTGSYC